MSKEEVDETAWAQLSISENHGLSSSSSSSSSSPATSFNFKNFILEAKIDLDKDDNNAINVFIDKVLQLSPIDKELNGVQLRAISNRLVQLQIYCDLSSDEPPEDRPRHSKRCIAKFSKFLNKFLTDEHKTAIQESRRKTKQLSKQKFKHELYTSSSFTISEPSSTPPLPVFTTFPHNEMIYQIVSQTVFDCLNPSLLDSQLNNTFMDMTSSFETGLDSTVKIEYEEFFMLIWTCLSDHSWNFPGFNSPPDRTRLTLDMVTNLNRMLPGLGNSNSNGSGNSNSNSNSNGGGSGGGN